MSRTHFRLSLALLLFLLVISIYIVRDMQAHECRVSEPIPPSVTGGFGYYVKFSDGCFEDVEPFRRHP